MNLDEAIQHCEEKEREQALNGCFACAEEHKQLAEWLKDYKRLLEERPKGEWTNISPYDIKGTCSLCCYLSNKCYNFCPNCGADMRKKR